MSKRFVTVVLIVAVSVASGLLGGCESEAQIGSVVGTLAGAGVGQIVGGDTESTLIGAFVGGTAGYMVGNEVDKELARAERDCLRRRVNTVVVKVTNSNGSIIHVRLRRQGVGYLGTRGEYYPSLPTEEQLRPVYGF